MSTAALQPPPFKLTQPQTSKCSTGCYVAKNICYPQLKIPIMKSYRRAAAAAAATAAAAAAESAKSSSYHQDCVLKKHDVFISFRGEDTRNNIISHLYKALCQSKIRTYIDENDIQKGDTISLELLKAIENSIISVIIFSENYASSPWCLDELNHIVHCREKNEQIVVPVFYHLDPSDVRAQQQGSRYAIALAAHEEYFKDKDKVQQWRNSLRIVANLSGWHVTVSRSEANAIEEIVKDIVEKLSHRSSSEITSKTCVSYVVKGDHLNISIKIIISNGSETSMSHEQILKSYAAGN